MRHVAIIGAGAVGVISAIEALRDGHRVTLIDPGEPGGTQAASYGNAGWLSSHSVIPPAEPGTWRKIPKYLLDPLGPLAIRWAYLPRALPWLIRYLWSGWTEAKVEATARALRPLRGRGGIPRVDQRQRHVVPRAGARQQVEALEHEAQHLAAQAREGRLAQARDVRALEAVAAAGGPVQAAEDGHEGRLPRARRAHDREELAAPHHQADAAQRVDVHVADAVAARDLAQLDAGRVHGDDASAAARPARRAGPARPGPRRAADPHRLSD